MTIEIERRAVLKSATAGVIMALLRGEGASATSIGVSSAGGRALAINQTITTLVPDRLYRIGCMVKAERLSWLSGDLDAYEPLNAYMFVDGENCIFSELGMPIALPAVKTALEMIGNRKVWVYFTRNEPDCIGNMGYVLGSCANPTLLYGTAGGVLEWINDPAVSILEVRDFLGRIPVASAKNGETKKIGSFDFKFTDAVTKQMITTSWALEQTTGCLFTSESLGFRHAATGDSSTVIDSPHNLPSVETVAKEMVARMHWMRESRFPEIIDRFEHFFKDNDVRMLAPVHGCVIKGRDAVEAHVALAIKAMRAAGRLPDTERLRYV